jgi:hypothetical protein
MKHLLKFTFLLIFGISFTIKLQAACYLNSCSPSVIAQGSTVTLNIGGHISVEAGCNLVSSIWLESNTEKIYALSFEQQSTDLIVATFKIPDSAIGAWIIKVDSDVIPFKYVYIHALPKLNNLPSLSKCVGETAVLECQATGDYEFKYQWKKDNIIIPGAITPKLSIGSLTAGDAGMYSCVVCNSVGTVESNAAKLDIYGLNHNAQFTADNKICQENSCNVKFIGNALSSSLYNWQFDGGTIINNDGNNSFEIKWSTPGEKNISLSVKENYCVAKETITVKVVNLSVEVGNDKSLTCGGSLILDNPTINYNDSEPLKYSWSPTTGIVDSEKQAQPTIEVIADTKYVLTVSNATGCLATDFLNVIANPLQAKVDNVIATCGKTIQLNATSNYSGTGNLSYDWSPANGLSSTTISNPFVSIVKPQQYTVEIKTPNGCSAKDIVTLNTEAIDLTPSICMVTVNNNDDNVIVWQKGESSAIDTFYIYRESLSQTGQFDLIGTQAHSTSGVFVDTASNAQIQSNIYTIAIKDICGYITTKSSEHKTAHLMINKGIGDNWNLFWEQYIGAAVSSYKIYRGTTRVNLSLIGTTSGSNTSYTDMTSPGGDVYYQIEVVLAQTCTNSRSAEYTTPRSNIVGSTDLTSDITSNTVPSQFIYPNPAFNRINITCSHSQNATLMIFDLQGKQLMNTIIDSEQIDISFLPKGIYMIKLIEDDDIITNKLIKE